MTNQEILSASSAILKKTKQLGVHLAGFANVDDLKVAPSFVFAPQLQGLDKVLGTLEGEMELDPGEVKWPEVAKSVLVVAVEHPEDKPELDWWYGQRAPSGNKLLINAVKTLCE
jgi:epoxyqueuosine reductase